MLVGQYHLSSAARSDDGNIELALRLRIGISPHLNKWSHLPPYSEYHYENIKDVVSPSLHHPTFRHWADDDGDEQPHRDEARRRNSKLGLRITTKRGAFVFDRDIWDYAVILARPMVVLPWESDGGKVP